jgi:hypothetical protein
VIPKWQNTNNNLFPHSNMGRKSDKYIYCMHVHGDTPVVCSKEDDRQNGDIYAESFLSIEYIYSEEYMYKQDGRR